MKFKELAGFLDRLEKTPARLEITQILSDLFKRSSEREIDKIVYLLLGGLAAKYENIVFNVAERLMILAVSRAYDSDPERVRKLYRSEGDLGIVAQKLAKNSTKNLSVLAVYEKLLKLAKDEGEGSQDRKIESLAMLLSSLDPLSARFVARIPTGKLRLGFSDKTIIDALSWMDSGDKSARDALERSYQVVPDVGKLALRVKKFGAKKGASGFKAKVGVPILPMLPQRLKKPAEMIEKMGDVSVEPKLDGLRLSLHYKSGKKDFYKAFTRNLNENAWMFPELKKLGDSIKAEDAILDVEVVGVDKKRKTLANFQTTMTRRRKHDIESISKNVSVKFFVFDILLKNGKSLMNETYIKRREVLEEVVTDTQHFEKVGFTITKDPRVIAKLNKKYKSMGLEGILIKKVDGRYVPGRTGWRWVKMKEAEGDIASLADTLDCVVMGFSAGRGKRAEFGVGQFLAGVRVGDKIKTLTKVGTGLTDEQFRELKKRLNKIRTKKRPKQYEVDKTLEPDYWVEPNLVVELAADEITKSPRHTSGYALRFPRLVRFRDDKSPAQSTSLTELKKLFKLQ